MNGRKFDVLIEDKAENEFICWADAGLKGLIASVEGVSAVEVGILTTTRYYVRIDHRYDIEYIKREVEAVILCRDADEQKG